MSRTLETACVISSPQNPPWKRQRDRHPRQTHLRQTIATRQLMRPSCRGRVTAMATARVRARARATRAQTIRRLPPRRGETRMAACHQCIAVTRSSTSRKTMGSRYGARTSSTTSSGSSLRTPKLFSPSSRSRNWGPHILLPTSTSMPWPRVASVAKS
jgi:hypothetical protein